MKRAAGTLLILTIGFGLGSTMPWAFAHPEEDCVCECPPCPDLYDIDLDGDGYPDMPVGPVIEFFDVQHPQALEPFVVPVRALPAPAHEHSPAEEAAIKKALEKIEQVEKKEEEFRREEAKRAEAKK